MKFGLQRGAGLSRNDVPFSKVRGVSGMLQDGPARTPLGEVCPVRAGGADPILRKQQEFAVGSADTSAKYKE